jgi:lipopolysaccharide export system protein LptA
MLRLSLVALSFLVLSPAFAKKDDRSQPMNVEHADSFSGFNAPNSVTTLTGHVVMSQGTMKVTGDLAKLYFDADQNISRIVVTGKPAHIQQLDDSGNLMTGDALTLDYDNIKGIAVLLTNAVVHQKGRGEAHGDKLTYNTQTSEMSGDSGGDGSVHMTFLPKPKPATSEPASQPAATAPAQGKPASAQSTATPSQEHH